MDSPRIPLSVLDLVPVSEGMGPGGGDRRGVDAAQLRDWTRSHADTALRVTAPVAEGTDIPM